MKITLHTVTKSDWDFIYQLRTNKQFKNNFYSQNSFTLNEHYAYLSKQENLSNFFHWMISIDNANVGYVRILDNDVSIIISEELQHQGIGTQALELVEKEAKSLGLTKLVGRVMIENKSSKKIFENNGYKTIMYWLEKNI